MTWQAQAWAWEQSCTITTEDGKVKPSPAAKLVLLSLANHSRPDHMTWPSVPVIAAETGLGSTAIKAALTRLAEAGLIFPTGHTRARRYRLADGTQSGDGPMAEPGGDQDDGTESGDDLTDDDRLSRETTPIETPPDAIETPGDHQSVQNLLMNQTPYPQRLAALTRQLAEVNA